MLADGQLLIEQADGLAVMRRHVAQEFFLAGRAFFFVPTLCRLIPGGRGQYVAQQRGRSPAAGPLFGIGFGPGVGRFGGLLIQGNRTNRG